VRSEDLKPEQIQRLCADLGRYARYLNRLCARMEQLGFPVSDAVYARSISARNSAEALLAFARDIRHPRAHAHATSRAAGGAGVAPRSSLGG
jgi:hypothetical protein